MGFDSGSVAIILTGFSTSGWHRANIGSVRKNHEAEKCPTNQTRLQLSR